MSDASKKLGKLDPQQSTMMEEMCLLVDKGDNVIGTKSKLDCHFSDGDRHRAFSVVIMNNDGEMLEYIITDIENDVDYDIYLVSNQF